MEESLVSNIKQQLQCELDSGSFNIYLQLLQEWFGQRLSKDLLEFEICSLFGEKCLDLHNQLIEAILKVSAGIEVGATSRQIPRQYTISGTDSSGDSNSGDADSPTSQENSNVYIIPTIPGEEPFVYPPNAEEYPPQPEVIGAVDMMEQDPPPDCDWLQEAVVTYPATENNIPPPEFHKRFPPWFAHEYQRVHQTSYAHSVNVVRNVTHVKHQMKEILERRPHLKQHFVIPADENVPYLSSGCSLYGRLLIKAWDYNIQNVNPSVTEYAFNTVKDHIKKVIMGILKQRRPFRMRDNRIMHSLGVPYPNPYLRQEFHMYDESCGTDTTKLAEVVMQVPANFQSIEEKERLAAMQVASRHPEKESRFLPNKGTMMDFYLAIQDNPAIIPNHRSRHNMMDRILRSAKGFVGTYNEEYQDEEDEEEHLLSSPLLPVVSY